MLLLMLMLVQFAPIKRPLAADTGQQQRRVLLFLATRDICISLALLTRAAAAPGDQQTNRPTDRPTDRPTGRRRVKNQLAMNFILFNPQ